MGVTYLKSQKFTLTSPHMCSAHKEVEQGTVAGDAVVWHSAMHTAVTTVDKKKLHTYHAGRDPKSRPVTWKQNSPAGIQPSECRTLVLAPLQGGLSGARGSWGVITQDLHICGITYLLLASAAALPALICQCRSSSPVEPFVVGQEQGARPRTMWVRSV